MKKMNDTEKLQLCVKALDAIDKKISSIKTLIDDYDDIRDVDIDSCHDIRIIADEIANDIWRVKADITD